MALEFRLILVILPDKSAVGTIFNESSFNLMWSDSNWTTARWQADALSFTLMPRVLLSKRSSLFDEILEDFFLLQACVRNVGEFICVGNY